MISDALAITDQAERAKIYQDILKKVVPEFTGIYYANEKMCWGVRNVVHDVIQEHKAVYRVCGSGLDDAGNAWKEA